MIKKIIYLILFFCLFEFIFVTLFSSSIFSKENDVGSEKSINSNHLPARGVRSVQGIDYPFHDPYNISQARKWIGFHKNIDTLYSIDELLKIHESQKTNCVTGKPAKSPLLRPKKLRIISTHFTRTDLLEIQYYSLKRYLKDTDWEYYVVNSAFEDESKNSKSMVLEFGIRMKIYSKTVSFNSPNVHHVFMQEKDIFEYIETRDDPASRCCNVIQWCLDNLVWDFDGYILFLDADAFFYDDINIGKIFIENDVIVGGRNNYRIVENKKYDFVTNNLLMIDPERLIDHKTFKFGRRIDENIDIDAGAQTYLYFNKHPQIARNNWWMIYQTILEYPLSISNNIDHLDPRIQRFFLEDKNRFFKKESYFTHVTEELNCVHYKRGSNWDHREKIWQILRGKFWVEFWLDFFGCWRNSEDEEFDCSSFFVYEESKLKYIKLLEENKKLRLQLEKNGKYL